MRRKPALETDVPRRQITATYPDGRVTRYTFTRAGWAALHRSASCRGHGTLGGLMHLRDRWIERGWLVMERLVEPEPYEARMAAELAANPGGDNLEERLRLSLGG